jgi:hypothetical protein
VFAVKSNAPGTCNSPANAEQASEITEIKYWFASKPRAKINILLSKNNTMFTSIVVFYAIVEFVRERLTCFADVLADSLTSGLATRSLVWAFGPVIA